MGLFSRRKLPASARPGLEKSERVLAWASTSEGAGAAVVVTNLGVWLPGRPERLSWHRVHKATWAASRLTVIGSVEMGTRTGYTVMADDAPIHIGLTDPDDVPAVIRDRVMKSVAYTAHYPLPGGGVRVVGRRVPGRDGLEWHVRYDEGTDADDTAVATATDVLVAAASAPDPTL
jgi:hypothetical protein